MVRTFAIEFRLILRIQHGENKLTSDSLDYKLLNLIIIIQKLTGKTVILWGVL
jgi:hypothetical protein